jgi:hypothetical protein
MPRRNQSRRVHAPYGEHPGIGEVEDNGGQRESDTGRREGGWYDERTMGSPDEMSGFDQLVSGRPYTSMLTGFGIGFGFGLLVTLLISRREESWFERYAPEALQDLPDRLKQARQQMASTVPSTVKHAGESLASYVPSSWKRW